MAAALRELALFLEMDDVPLEPQAYEHAAFSVAPEVEELAHDLTKTEGDRAIAGRTEAPVLTLEWGSARSRPCGTLGADAPLGHPGRGAGDRV